MISSLFESDHGFHLERIAASDMPQIASFVHRVAETAGQSVYVVALEVAGRELGEPIEPVVTPGFPIRQGSRDLPRGKMQFGSDVVIWHAETEQTTAYLIGEHLRDYWINWAVVVDAGNALMVAQDARAHSDSLWTFDDTVGPQRALVMANYDPGPFFTGRVAPHAWEVARAHLARMGRPRENCDEQVTEEA